jgi:regulator of sirC expression with transglutaminase-like and TPR domain
MVVSPTHRFAHLMSQPDPRLDEVCTVIVQHVRPAYGLADARGELDRLAAGAREAGASEPKSLCRWLFVTEGFSGNEIDYYDPDNSYLDRVLSRRVGIPISLCAVAVEVGRRVGIDLGIVGMPGHVLLVSREMPDRFLDPFGGGTVLDRRAVEHRFRAIFGDLVELKDSMLGEIPIHAVVDRMLANLQQIYSGRSDDPSARADLEWILALRGACRP